MNKTPTLQAKNRERIGSRYAKRVREGGGLPAVLYGHKQDPRSITLDAKEARRVFESGERVYTLSIEGGKSETALLKDVQFDYLGTNIIHADFERVDLNEEVEVHVSIHLVGEAVGLKTAGAILLHPVNEITVRCKVKDIRDHIDLDISGLDAGKSIHAREITLPAGFALDSDGDAVVAAIQVQKEVEEATGEAATAEGAESTQPEVIRERKPEDEGDAKKQEKK